MTILRMRTGSTESNYLVHSRILHELNPRQNLSLVFRTSESDKLFLCEECYILHT